MLAAASRDPCPSVNGNDWLPDTGGRMTRRQRRTIPRELYNMLHVDSAGFRRQPVPLMNAVTGEENEPGLAGEGTLRHVGISDWNTNSGNSARKGRSPADR